MMSKKDYQAIARLIHEVRSGNPAFTQHFDGRPDSPADEITKGLGDIFRRDNPRFDRERFVEACETGTTHGMPKRSTNGQ